jgi:hypothetical protein
MTSRFPETLPLGWSAGPPSQFIVDTMPPRDPNDDDDDDDDDDEDEDETTKNPPGEPAVVREPDDE